MAETIFQGENCIDQEIGIQGHYYRIVGVLSKRADNEKGSEDDIVYIPYTNAQQLSKTNKINNVYFQVSNNSLIANGVDRINSFLGELIEDEEQFSVYSMNTIIENLTAVMDKFTTALLGVAFISLLVGGIGIMNIMYVSIAERRKEIGIRLALGATPKNVMYQFIIESTTLSCIGGLLGVILEIIGLYIATELINILFVISYTSILLAVGISIFIGIVFGTLPAIKASQTDPIESLRL